MKLTKEQQQEIKDLQSQENQTKRVIAPELEKILFEAIPILDHGFIRVIDYMGDDTSIVQAARVSYGKGTKKVSTDSGLITLKSNKMYAAIRNEKTRKNSYRQMYLHSPNLFKWGDTESFGFYVNEQEKPIYPGGRILQLYPKDGSLFWYYKIDAAYTRRAEPIV